ncbi:sugar ABC transporter permease [Treponema parvum]|uniref:Sugar ABC transporter permease n=1 Tax=Treponema parvum TaxID=138851 RepID=A0A975IFR2_9SPIR|nr:sugar ABC transporter permease [Treponema parvum]QTQ14594.1 sugar ABC transporter permease [Treponema parvum]
MNKTKVRRLNDTSYLFYLFICPWLIGLCFFVLFPMFFSLFTSFTDWNGTNRPSFIGFNNYKFIFTVDKLFQTSLKNTIFYVGFSLPLNLIISIALAVLLNRRSKLFHLFRAIFYLPTICTGVASYITWLYLYNSDFGFINLLLSKIAIRGPLWLSDTNTAMLSIIIMDMFVCGTSMTIVLASLQEIPSMYYEVADLEGANSLHKFFYITFPMISPVVFFNLLITLIKGLQIFTQPYVMTEGGPANSTYVYGLHLYKTAFLYANFGYASSLAWVLFIFLLIVSGLIFASSRFWVFYEEKIK